MINPYSPEVDIHALIPGQQYYAISEQKNSYFIGLFTDYYTNEVGYNMIRFHYTHQYHENGYMNYIDSPEKHPWGSYWRIFENPRSQSYRFYRTVRFTNKEKKELMERRVQYERRNYERGLTGTTPQGVYLPRDLVREISLKYLTSFTVAKPYRNRPRNRPVP